MFAFLRISTLGIVALSCAGFCFSRGDVQKSIHFCGSQMLEFIHRDVQFFNDFDVWRCEEINSFLRISQIRNPADLPDLKNKADLPDLKSSGSPRSEKSCGFSRFEILRICQIWKSPRNSEIWNPADQLRPAAGTLMSWDVQKSIHFCGSHRFEILRMSQMWKNPAHLPDLKYSGSLRSEKSRGSPRFEILRIS